MEIPSILWISQDLKVIYKSKLSPLSLDTLYVLSKEDSEAESL